MMNVNVILCSRNGARYLREQIDSILKQTDPCVRLLISDDASTDGTREILREYMQQYPDRVRVHFRETPSGGAARHFFLALKMFASWDAWSSDAGSSEGGKDASYFMFADQDDVWHPDKVEKTLEVMQEEEREAAASSRSRTSGRGRSSGGGSAYFGSSVPVLVHCDMRVVDEEGGVIAPSYVQYQKMTPSRNGMNKLLVQNNVTGGALMMNEALVQLLLKQPGGEKGALQERPLPEHAVMHDHWIALAAAAFGKVVFLDEALYDYRQHGENVLGAAKGSRVREVLDRLGIFRRDGKTKADMDRHSASVYTALFRQAAEFGRLYGPELSPEKRRMLAAFVRMRKVNRPLKILLILRYGFTFNKLHRTVGECLFI